MVKLLEFRDRNVCTCFSNQVNALLRVSSTETIPLNEEPIACNDCFRLADALVEGCDPSTQLGGIVDVIVDERSCVNQLKGHCKVHDFVDVAASCNLVTKDSKQRTQPFATTEQNFTRELCNLSCTLLQFTLNQRIQRCVDLLAKVLEA